MLKKPFNGNFRITSPFGWRANPFTNSGQEFHDAVDWATPLGTPILASQNGEVTTAEFSTIFGNLIRIKNNNVITRYSHLSKLSVVRGQIVKQGQKIGEAGSTGRSTGAHLDFAVFVNGKAVDPITILNNQNNKNMRQQFIDLINQFTDPKNGHQRVYPLKNKQALIDSLEKQGEAEWTRGQMRRVSTLKDRELDARRENDILNNKIKELEKELKFNSEFNKESQGLIDNLKNEKELLQSIVEELENEVEETNQGWQEVADEYIKELEDLTEKPTTAKPPNPPLPMYKRAIFDTLREGSFALSGVLGATGLFELATVFIADGDFSQEAFNKFGLSVVLAVAGYIQSKQKAERKSKEK